MENKEIMNTEEIVETDVNETVEETSEGLLGTAAIVGLTLLGVFAGKQILKRVVKPGVAKFQGWMKNRKTVAEASAEDDTDEDPVIHSEDNAW